MKTFIKKLKIRYLIWRTSKTIQFDCPLCKHYARKSGKITKKMGYLQISCRKCGYIFSKGELYGKTLLHRTLADLLLV